VRFVSVVVAVFVEDFDEVIGAVDVDRHIAKPALLLEIVEKPPCRYVVRCRKEAQRDDLVGVGIDGAVQPELLTVEADHLLVDRELIRRDRRGGL
jgi:hypothetical protein